ncbi:MAG: hypothetical protein HY692_07110 [Cyanobacteria bacterium NC_groundwater_1444_Ag_S-0.65um_54_12]|nr:hypothetical protein [Cyanobacteria bacterium NC_groundwater_1444_Ag_S-0.65um_54_12]
MSKSAMGQQQRLSHRRFDPVLAKRDALAAVLTQIDWAQKQNCREVMSGQAIRLRRILELEALRELEQLLHEFDPTGLALLARVQAAELLRQIGELAPMSTRFWSELFRLRQCLLACGKTIASELQLICGGKQAVSALEQAIWRLPAMRSQRHGAKPIHTMSLLEEQRTLALLELIKAMNRLRLHQLTDAVADRLLLIFQQLDPLQAGFDPRDKQFAGRMANLLGNISSIVELSSCTVMSA